MIHNICTVRCLNWCLNLFYVLIFYVAGSNRINGIRKKTYKYFILQIFLTNAMYNSIAVLSFTNLWKIRVLMKMFYIFTVTRSYRTWYRYWPWYYLSRYDENADITYYRGDDRLTALSIKVVISRCQLIRLQFVRYRLQTWRLP